MKPEEREKGTEASSRHGLSIKAITAALGVSSSSVSRWVRDIELTPAQLAALGAAVRLAVFSTFIVQSIYGAIQAYAGIDRPAWLD